MPQNQKKQQKHPRPDRPVDLTQQTEGSRQIANTIKNFDQLPDSALIRPRVMQVLFGVSRATLARMSADGRLPKPKKLGTQVCGFLVAEVRRAQQAIQSS